jgi:hypothetical protein
MVVAYVAAATALFPLPAGAQLAVTVAAETRETAAGLDVRSQSAVFSVVNSSAQDEVYGLACETSGAVTACSIQDPIVRLAPGESARVTVGYKQAIVGSGSVWLKVSSFYRSVEGKAESPVPDARAASVSVSPDGVMAERRAENASGLSEVFTVVNTGPATHTFDIACGQAGNVVCRGVSQSSVTLEAGVSADVTVTYETSDNGFGVLLLTATSTVDPSVVEQGAFNVRVGAR